MRNTALTVGCLALVLTACVPAASRQSTQSPVTAAPSSSPPERVKASSWPAPNRSLTPGAIVPGCVPRHRPPADRATGAVTRTQLAAHYHVARLPAGTEGDHLVPFQLCGANDLRNVWPEGPDDRTVSVCKVKITEGCVVNRKDELEQRIYDTVADPEQAQQIFLQMDWRVAWCRYVHTPDVDCGGLT